MTPYTLTLQDVLKAIIILDELLMESKTPNTRERARSLGLTLMLLHEIRRDLTPLDAAGLLVCANYHPACA